ncbi:Uncharacterised protein [uncultured archaeon]|nr:Uncharacterised protein [uncultured archaeon]
MIDPLSLLMIGGGILAWREMNRKDYGILTPSRDERYRNAMEYCHQPELLMQEAKLFDEFGLKAQAAMLKRRAEWRGRSAEEKQAHEEVYQKALHSSKIPAILAVADAFEGWTATKKASNLREHVRVLQEASLQEAAQNAAEAAKKGNGAGKVPVEPFTGVIDIPPTVGDDDT